MERIIALFLFVFFSPFLLFLYLIFHFFCHGSFIFKQKRMGKGGKVFEIYKIRTMVENAESLKKRYTYLNEADKPAFKIKNDPRYTKLGKFLARTAFDELPQLVNIVRGEMAFVGPRPLPIEEAKKVAKKYQARFSVLPGMTSLWIIRGADHRSFNKWMRLDMEYLRNKNIWYDLIILAKTAKIIMQNII